jgi:hypothetical protein
MILFLLAYLGGVLTIVSPCILPVLPFVFARADRPFVSSGLPLLAGMAATFAAVATLAAVGGGWVVEANQYGRIAAIALLALFGITLLFPSLSDRVTRPLVALGARLSQSVDHGTEPGRSAILPSLLLGVATGLLWAPCAGPVLGLILTGAALSIVYRFHARDVHLVLGPAPDGKAVQFRVTIDGAPPGDSHGADSDTDGHGVVTEQRLYQLVRQSGAIADHTFEIHFLDPGVQAYAFTFG